MTVSPSEAVLVISNAAALVWGAATLRAEVRALRRDMDDVKGQVQSGVEALRETLIDHAERLSRLEGRHS